MVSVIEEGCAYEWRITDVDSPHFYQSGVFSQGPLDKLKWQMYCPKRDLQDLKPVGLFLKMVSAFRGDTWAKYSFSIRTFDQTFCYSTRHMVVRFGNDNMIAKNAYMICMLNREDMGTFGILLKNSDSVLIVIHIEAIVIQSVLPLPVNPVSSRQQVAKNTRYKFNDDKESDVKIYCCTVQFKAHKNLLVAKSPRFETMLKDVLKSVIYITDLETDIVEKLIRFIYGEEIEVLDFDTAWTLLEAAKVYGIQDLHKFCIDHLIVKTHSDNVYDALLLSDAYNIPELKLHAMHCFTTNLEKHSFLDFENMVMSRPSLLTELILKVISIYSAHQKVLEFLAERKTE